MGQVVDVSDSIFIPDMILLQPDLCGSKLTVIIMELIQARRTPSGGLKLQTSNG